MTALSQTVQHGVVPTRYNKYAAGQIASNLPYKIMSGRYTDSTTNKDHPIKFGYGVGHGSAEGTVVQDITRNPVFNMSQNLNSGATSITFDPDGNGTNIDAPDLINVGDFIQIENEVFLVTGIGASALTVVGAQKGTSSSSHNGSSTAIPVYNLSGTSNFAGVALRDVTIAGRFNTSEVDAFIDQEIVPVMFDGEVVCAFYDSVTAADLGKQISVIGNGNSMGLFRKGTDDANTILIPNTKIVSTSEDLGSGNTPRYLAVVRFNG